MAKKDTRNEDPCKDLTDKLTNHLKKEFDLHEIRYIECKDSVGGLVQSIDTSCYDGFDCENIFRRRIDELVTNICIHGVNLVAVRSFPYVSYAGGVYYMCIRLLSACTIELKL